MARIVLAEDRNLHRRELSSIMETEHDFHVDEAGDGWEAWDKTQRLKPDLLVVNSRMRGLSGREIAQRALGMSSRPHTVIIREDDSLSYVCEAFAGGVMGFAIKNNNNEEFTHNVQEILQGRFIPRLATFWSYSA